VSMDVRVLPWLHMDTSHGVMTSHNQKYSENGEAPRFAPAAGLPLWEKNTRVFPSPKLQRAGPDLVPHYSREIIKFAKSR
jgi:hypothetical protein